MQSGTLLYMTLSAPSRLPIRDSNSRTPLKLFCLVSLLFTHGRLTAITSLHQRRINVPYIQPHHYALGVARRNSLLFITSRYSWHNLISLHCLSLIHLSFVRPLDSTLSHLSNYQMKRAESILVEEDTFDIAHITGNASDEIKRTAGNPSYFFTYLRPDKVKSPIFGSSIQKRLKVTEISINKKQEEESKLEARIVLEIDVTEGEWKFVGLLEFVTDPQI